MQCVRPPETITQPRGYDHTDEKNTENVFTSANRREHRTEQIAASVPLRVAGPKKEIDTYALLDDGSTVTLIDSDLAQQLGARGRNEPYT
ncbi:hypothetical protein EVAR_35850_1 [Eumeta japonica]|uniref:Uncharacterized protein n=1 Tax=Eumeta variegata TaxID=151549 RepID=A0A4C1X000_EUMVA|nr:hypothetical protein EVAR_35850_1 [Eumeta japonica]